MPTTSQDFKHKQQAAHQHTHGHPKPKRKAAGILAIIAAIAGALIAYISNSDNLLWVLVGAVIGGIIGYIFGHNIDKAVDKK